MELVRMVGREVLDSCPAAMMIDGQNRPTLIINSDTFPLMSDYEQRFALAHELGHYIMNTGVEEVADAFALGALAGTEPRSLKQSVAALYHLRTIPTARLQALYERAQKIDQQQNLKQMMKQNLNKQFAAPLVMREDGAQVNAPVVAEPQTMQQAANAAQVIGDLIVGNNRRRAGVRINNVFFSVESILLAALLVVSVIALCKR